jgi:hypothetical protein
VLAALKIIRNQDGTITIKVGGYRETISTTAKSQMQIIDEVRWVAITAGVSVSEETIYSKLTQE